MSHETIYATIYATPRGELRKDLIRCLRQGEDRRGRLPDMVSIHERPPEVEGRLVPGHWEADLIKGAGNRSAVATLVEHTSWQRGNNENANGLSHEYLPKGTDLSEHSQEELNAIAHQLDTRPRAVLGFKMPIEVFAEHLDAVIESRHAVKH